MNTWINVLLVGAGGMLGSMLRYGMSLLPVRSRSGFPVITLAINLIGALAIGLIAALAGKSGHGDSRLVLFLKVGLCGGFTTFSTFSWEAAELLQSGRTGTGLCYIALSAALCVAAVFAARALVG
ncbi:MAG: fluoride efflux transporter CrcB [Candidatus Merdivicinus sp.]